MLRVGSCALARTAQIRRLRWHAKSPVLLRCTGRKQTTAADAHTKSYSMTPRVLSIQSHTVHGYVGNRCCVFPLQRLGLEVDFINSVQFSNHTGYPSFKGSVVDGKQLQELLDGLQANNLATHSHLITGYIGSVSLLRKVLDVVAALRTANPDLVYVCDPVMGDDGRLYVASELLDCFRDEIVPAASIMTPNQYEAELLVGFPVKSVENALRACQALHQKGPHTVVITSFCPQGGSADALALIASTTQPQRHGRPPQFQIRVPKVDGYFTGTGDLMAALILAHTEKHPDDLASAVEHALCSTQGILRATVEAAGPAATATERTAEVSNARELRLVANQHLLVQPDVTLRAEALQGSYPNVLL